MNVEQAHSCRGLTGRGREALTLGARGPLPAILADAGERVAPSYTGPAIFAGARRARAVLS